LRFVTDRRGDVVAFVTSRIDYPLSYQNVLHEAVGGEDETGRLRFGVVFHLFKPLLGGHDIEFNGAKDADWCLPRAMIAASFRFAFIDLEAIRLTATVQKKNKASRKALCALGFTHEGSHKWGLGPGLDALSYGMTYRHCRWLTDEDKTLISRRIDMKRKGI